MIAHVLERHEWTNPQTAKRCQTALKSWEVLYEEGKLLDCSTWNPERLANDEALNRKLPYLKDVLKPGLDHDLVLLTNDDTIIHPSLIRVLELWLPAVEALSLHRVEIPAPSPVPITMEPERFRALDNGHIGRDAFAFTGKRLREWWNDIPDFVLGECEWDLCLAHMIREWRGYTLTFENASKVVLGCELQKGMVLHVFHEGRWNHVKKSRTKTHNRSEYRRWAHRHGLTLDVNFAIG